MASTSFQARFITRDTRISIGEPTVDLESSVNVDNLNSIVKALVKIASNIAEDVKSSIESGTFEFIIGGRLLRQSIDQHLET